MVPKGSAFGGVQGQRPLPALLVFAGPGHAAAMAAAHAGAFDLAGEAWPAAAFATQLASPGVFGFVVEAGGVVLARVAADEAEILTIGVAWSARRRGLARALLDAVEATAAERGAHAMFLEVSERNGPARALYEVAGYAEVGRRRRYYPDGSDALVLRRVLLAA